MVTTVRRLVEALVTALAVVFGLRPDPTRVPVRVESRREY